MERKFVAPADCNDVIEVLECGHERKKSRGNDDERTTREEGSASTHCDEEDSIMLGLGG